MKYIINVEINVAPTLDGSKSSLVSMPSEARKSKCVIKLEKVSRKIPINTLNSIFLIFISSQPNLMIRPLKMCVLTKNHNSTRMAYIEYEKVRPSCKYARVMLIAPKRDHPQICSIQYIFALLNYEISGSTCEIYKYT